MNDKFFGILIMALLLASLFCLVLSLYHFCRWAKYEADAERHRLREVELQQRLNAMKRDVQIDYYADYCEHRAQDRNAK